MSARQRKSSSVGNLVARFEGLHKNRSASRGAVTIPKPWDRPDSSHPLAVFFARWWRAWQTGKLRAGSQKNGLASILAQRRTTCQGDVDKECESAPTARPVPGKLNLAEVTAPLQLAWSTVGHGDSEAESLSENAPTARPIPGKLDIAKVTAPLQHLQMAFTTAGPIASKAAAAPLQRSRIPVVQSRSLDDSETQSAPMNAGHCFHVPKDGVLPSGGRLRIGKVKIPEGLLAWKMPVQLAGPACPNSDSFAHGYVPEVPKTDKINQGQRASQFAPMLGKYNKARPPPGPPPPGKYGKAAPPPGPPPPGKYGKAASSRVPSPPGKSGKAAFTIGPTPPGKSGKGIPPPGPPPPGKNGKAAPLPKHSFALTPAAVCKGKPPGPPPPPKSAKAAQLQSKPDLACQISESSVMGTELECMPMQQSSSTAASMDAACAGPPSPSLNSDAAFHTAEPVDQCDLEEDDAAFHTAEGAEGFFLEEDPPGKAVAKDTATELVKSAQAFLLDHGLTLAKQGRKQAQPSSEHERVRIHSEADTDSDGEDVVQANNASDVLAAAKAFSKGLGNVDYFRCLASGGPDVFSASLRSEFWVAPPGVRSRFQSSDSSESMSIHGSLQPCPEDGALDESPERKKAVRLQLRHIYAGAAHRMDKTEAPNTPTSQKVLAASLQDQLDASMAKLAAVGALLEEQRKQLHVERLCKQKLLEQLARNRTRPRSLSSVGFECSESLAEAQKALELASEDQRRLEVALCQERRCSGKLNEQVEELSSELEELQKQLPSAQAQELLQESLRRMAAAEERCDELLAELNDERGREEQLQLRLQALEQEKVKTETDETQSQLQCELDNVSSQLLDAEANQQRLQQLLRDEEANKTELSLQLQDLRKRYEEQEGRHQQQTSETLQQLGELREALAAERETKAILLAQLDRAAPQSDVAAPLEEGSDLQQEMMEASLRRLASAEYREEELQAALQEALQAERESKLLAHAEAKARELELSQELDEVLSVKQQLEAQLAADAQERDAMAGETKESLAMLASSAAQWKEAQQALQEERQEKLALQERLDELQHDLSMVLQSHAEEHAQGALRLQDAMARLADVEADREELARREAQAQKDLDEAQERQCEAEEHCREMEGKLLSAEVGDYSMDALKATSQKAWNIVRTLQDEVQRAIRQKTKVELEKDELEAQLETSQDEVQRVIQQRTQAELQRDKLEEQLEQLCRELEAATKEKYQNVEQLKYQLTSQEEKPLMLEVALLEDQSSSLESLAIGHDLKSRKCQDEEQSLIDLEGFEQRRRWRSSDEEQLVNAQRQQEESLDELRAALARLGTVPGGAEATAGHQKADSEEAIEVAKVFVAGLTKQVKLQIELQQERDSTQTILSRMTTQLQPQHVHTHAEEKQDETALVGNVDATTPCSHSASGLSPVVACFPPDEAEAAADLIKSAQAFLLARGLASARHGRKQRQPSSEHKRVRIRIHTEADDGSDGENAARANDASDVLAAANAFSRGFENLGYFRHLGSGSPDVFSASLRSEFWAAPPGVRSRLQSCDLSECMSIADSLLQPCPEGEEGLTAQCEDQESQHAQQTVAQQQQLDELHAALAAEQETKALLEAQLDGVATSEEAVELTQTVTETGFQHQASSAPCEEELQAAALLKQPGSQEVMPARVGAKERAALFGPVNAECQESAIPSTCDGSARFVSPEKVSVSHDICKLLPGVQKRSHEPSPPNLLAQRQGTTPGTGWPNLLSKPSLEEKQTLPEKAETVVLLQERWKQERHSNMILSSRLAGLQQELSSMSAERNDLAELAEQLQQQLQGTQWQLSAAEAKQEELLQLWQEDLAGAMGECSQVSGVHHTL